MSNTQPAAALLLSLLVATCAAPPPPGSAACAPKPLARLPVAFHGGIPTIAAQIDGQPVTMVLDLGAEVSVLAETTADRLHLTRDPSALPTITGVGGSMMRWAAIAGHLRLADLTLNDKRMEVAPMLLGSAQHPIDGALGLDVLRKYDIDWDLPHHLVTLNAGAGCDGPPAGWPSPSVEVSLHHPMVEEGSGPGSKLILIPVTVDGRKLTAMLDTGSGADVIDPAAAASLEPLDARGEKIVHFRGIGPGSEAGFIYRFASLTVAGETVTGPEMAVGPVPIWAGSGMVLGVRFMRRHRAWLPAGDSSIWFGPPEAPQPAGAPSVPSPPATAGAL